MDEKTLENRLTKLETEMQLLCSLVKSVRDNEQNHVRWLLGLLTLTLIPLLLKLMNLI